MKKTLRWLLSAFFLLVFCYLVTVLNLFKATKKIDFNIFKSPALKEFLVFAIVVLPLFFVLNFMRKRFFSKNDNFQDK